ncbi:IS5 family transposase [Acidithiobacillus sp. CV18-2]|nr:IS5 family transposase [Acidithiobacillus sp. CV18-3]MBU2757462.1 IS5 family transposase [Acidithiobacillus sp. BN09-2]MBU2776493.1 IS5 family transposase [Acidithiobacillus sp. CV18-2]MBU2798397.1 IS5 family transposase [Acidithiobacillus sp. VAN18-4]
MPKDHPLRAIQMIIDRSLAELDGHSNQIYSDLGRPSIPPEHLLRAFLLQVFYSVCSERQLIEQLEYNLLFRWFVGLGMDDSIWVPTVFTKNRDRLLDNGTVQRFFQTILVQARHQGFLSEEHFSVDGTLLEAWASQKSFQPNDPEDRQGGGSDFRGQKRSNDTHASVTDPDCRLYKKAPGDASRLAYLGYVLMDNRQGLIVGDQVTTADGTAEVDAALQLMDDLGGSQRITLGADKGYDRHGFFRDRRDRNVTPHVARKCKGSGVDGRTTRHVGYSISTRVRKRIESIFGWMKTVGGMRKTRFRRLERVGMHFTLVSTAYNLVRMARLGVA